MRGTLLLLILCVGCVVAVQDFKCLKKCAKTNQAIKAENAAAAKKKKNIIKPLKNCLHMCELTNKRTFAKRVLSDKLKKKAAQAKKKGLIKHATHVVGRKALKHTHPKQHLTPLQKKLAMLQKEVSEEEKERHEFMEEMKEDMGEVNKDRAHDRKDHHNEKEDKELMEELRKYNSEHAKLIKITHEEMKNKMEEAVDEHGQLFGKSAKTEKVLKNWRKTNISAKSGYACLRGCLLAIHNVQKCKNRCNLSKKEIKAKKADLKKKIIKKKKMEKKALKNGCGPCYGAKPKGLCCNTCAEVKKAYATKKWALPKKGRFVQCKPVKFTKKTLAKKNLHSRIFRGAVTKKQHKTNKVIHKMLFKKMVRHTQKKGHFKPKNSQKKKSRKMKKAEKKHALEVVKKWEKYHKKRWAGKHAKVAPTFLKNLKSQHKVRHAAPVMRQQGMLLRMNKAQLKRWQMLKIHSWSSKAHKSVLNVKVAKAKKAAQKSVETKKKTTKKTAKSTKKTAKSSKKTAKSSKK